MIAIKMMLAKRLFPLAAIGLLAACGGTPPVESGPVLSTQPGGIGAYSFAAPTRLDSTYAINAKDVLSVSVLGEPQLSMDTIRVGEDGAFMMPIVGRVQASGRTVNEVANEIRTTLASRYLRNPNVTVNLIELNSHFVTVDGAVQQSGVFAFEPGTTLMGAVAMAKGPTDVAQLDQVIVFREMNGQLAAARFDLNLVRTGQMVDPLLEPEDRIMIGQSGANKAWRDLLDVLPAFAIFSVFR